MNISEVKKEQENLKKEIRERTMGYIMAAFGFVAGLAWNEAIKSLIDQFFPFSKDGVLIKFIYAILVTLILVVVTVYLIKFLGEKDKVKK